jgi:uncharacterized protein (DUF885 family)
MFGFKRKSRREFLAEASLIAASMSAAGRSAQAAESQDAKFTTAAHDYIATYLELTPEIATTAGEHRYDGRLTDRSEAGRNRILVLHRGFLLALDSIDSAQLQLQNRIDYQIARNRAESAVWSQTFLREFEWDSAGYNPGNSIYLLLERDFAPLPDRLESLRSRLDAIPEYLHSAKLNLKNPPRIFTETAIAQNKGTLSLVRNMTSEQAAKVLGMNERISPSQARAAAALEDWGQWLEKELLPRSSRDFRIGPELFAAKLRYTLDSPLTIAQIRERAQAELKKAQQDIYETAVLLARRWSPSADVSDHAKTVRMVLDRLAEQRPAGADVIAKAESDVREATGFVVSHKLMSVPASPLQVVPMPDYQRGVAVANCSSPGPLEKHGQTFLNISPPPEAWNAEQVTSFYREYNDWMLKDLVVHEGMPGHYLQIAHGNRFSAPTIVRALFRSGSFVEGWAVYAERLMADNGFGGPEVRMQQLKMWMRGVINALLDIGIHTEGMTEQQAMDLMMNEGYQERSEAAGKWRRANLSSTQLSTYFVGASELYQFREDYQKRHGPIRDWRVFHDRMLSFGSPAPRYLSQLMI